MRRRGLALMAVSAVLLAAPGAEAAVYNASNTADTGGTCSPAPAVCTLRQALNMSNLATDADTIQLVAGTYSLASELTVGDTALTIQGAGPASSIISGGDATRILNSTGTGGRSITLRGIAFRNGQVTGQGGAVFVGINRLLTATDVAFTDNEATGGGGAVHLNGPASGRFTRVSFTRNETADDGGAIVANPPNDVTFNQVTFTQNKAGPDRFGGAVMLLVPAVSRFTDVVFDRNEAGRGGAFHHNGGTATMTRVTAVGNKALDASSGGGGAMHFFSPTTLRMRDSLLSGNSAVGTQGGGAMRFNASSDAEITNTTISGNTATGRGGAMQIDSTPTRFLLTNTTIAGNSATGTGAKGGAISVNLPTNVSLRNNVLAGNSAPTGAGCDNALSSGGGNVSQLAGCGLGASDRVGVNPLLSPLAANGGPTLTRAIGLLSPAHDAGVAATCPATDQRGAPRVPGRCDAGAFELAPPLVQTGTATVLGTTRATLRGTVNPLFRPSTYRFDFGRATSFGRSTTAQSTAGTASAAPAVTVRGLRQDTLYHYRLSGSSVEGTSLGADRTFRTRNARPSLSRLGITRKRFPATAQPSAAQRRRKRKVGTAFRFRLSEAATVRIAIEKPARGRRVGRRCRKVTRKNRARRRCTRHVKLATLRRKGKAGRNTVRFNGKVKRRALRPGRYRATARATDSRRTRSRARSVKFRVIP